MAYREHSTESDFTAIVRREVEDGIASGLYCAETVAQALAKAQGLEAAAVTRMATAFCSGMSQTCGTCGALTGAMLGVSLALGRSDGDESAEAAYEATQSLVRAFEREFGARDCHALLGCDLGTREGRLTFSTKRLHERCARYTIRAAELAAALIAANGKR